MSNLCQSSDLRIVKKILLVYEIESKIREVFVNICIFYHAYIIHISDMVLFNSEIAKIRVIFFSRIDLALYHCRSKVSFVD